MRPDELTSRGLPLLLLAAQDRADNPLKSDLRRAVLRRAFFFPSRQRGLVDAEPNAKLGLRFIDKLASVFNLRGSDHSPLTMHNA